MRHNRRRRAGDAASAVLDLIEVRGPISHRTGTIVGLEDLQPLLMEVVQGEVVVIEVVRKFRISFALG
jgi:hypothetical protein